MSSRWVWVGAACLLLAFALDRWHAQAGLWMLIFLVGTLGSLHGVLDTVLIVRSLHQPRARWLAVGAYLLATVISAAALRDQPAWALMLLLSLSLWHFGEHFGPATNPSPSPINALCQRLLLGGAPVLMPALLAPTQLAPLAQVVAAGEGAAFVMLWSFWTGLAWAWLFLLVVWLLASFVRPAWACGRRRPLLIEVALVAALNGLTSPLMAFALYFGLHHASGHIRRVWMQTSAHARAREWRDWRVWVTGLLTLALVTALLFWVQQQLLQQQQLASAAVFDVALRAVILALVAVSVPHVVLISWWARRLRDSSLDRLLNKPLA